MIVTPVISSGLESNCLLCAAETSGTRQTKHSAETKCLTSSSGTLTIYQLCGADDFGKTARQKHRRATSRLPGNHAPELKRKHCWYDNLFIFAGHNLTCAAYCKSVIHPTLQDRGGSRLLE